MTARKPQAEVEAYRRRVRELRAESVELAGAQGQQLTLDVGPLARVVDIRPRRRRRRGWVPS